MLNRIIKNIILFTFLSACTVEIAGGGQWFPFLTIAGGKQQFLGQTFNSEKQCEKYIKNYVLDLNKHPNFAKFQLKEKVNYSYYCAANCVPDPVRKDFICSSRFYWN